MYFHQNNKYKEIRHCQHSSLKIKQKFKLFLISNKLNFIFTLYKSPTVDDKLGATF